MKTVEERLRSYEPLWENWTYSGEFLGEGAMSSVFEIQSTAMGLREVAALKIITVKKNYRGEVRIPESALNEIKILRELSGCPNIVRYQDSTQRQIFDDNNELAEIDILIKMEKLTPLTESDNLSPEQVIKLAKDICTALTHANEHGIIHRDIKPQNIFVDSEGTYKLGDFGIAKIVSDFSGHFTMNIGTLAYAAPEIHSNPTGKYDISSDIYSLGLVLYTYLNNGCMPFVNATSSLNEAISKRLAGAPFPSPSGGSKNLKTIVMRACNSDPAKRYRTPSEMLDDLELLSTGGKKLVVDPFATLDANLDVTEVDELYLDESAPKTDGTVTFGSLKIQMTRATDSSAPSGIAPSGSRLKINMMRTAPPSHSDNPAFASASSVDDLSSVTLEAPESEPAPAFSSASPVADLSSATPASPVSEPATAFPSASPVADLSSATPESKPAPAFSSASPVADLSSATPESKPAPDFPSASPVADLSSATPVSPVTSTTDTDSAFMTTTGRLKINMRKTTPPPEVYTPEPSASAPPREVNTADPMATIPPREVNNANPFTTTIPGSRLKINMRKTTPPPEASDITPLKTDFIFSTGRETPESLTKDVPPTSAPKSEDETNENPYFTMPPSL